MLALQLSALGAIFPRENVLETLVPLALDLCTDAVAEVRIAAIGQIGKLLALLFSAEPQHSFVTRNAEHKCALGWGVALLRGVGANWLVCLGWWQALSCPSEDTVSKIFAIWWPTFTFTSIGFEHSIASASPGDDRTHPMPLLGRSPAPPLALSTLL